MSSLRQLEIKAKKLGMNIIKLRGDYRGYKYNIVGKINSPNGKIDYTEENPLRFRNLQKLENTNLESVNVYPQYPENSNLEKHGYF